MASKHGICENCNQPRWISAKKRCAACYNYWKVTGKERPLRPLGRKPYPMAMCDCGRAPASRVLVVKNGKMGHKVRIRVCELCWELEKG